MKRKCLQVRVIPVDAHVYIPISLCTVSTNCIVVWRKRKAVVVDPGGEGERVSRFLKRNKLTVGAYWLTHAHPDHVGGLSELMDKFPAPVRYHRADANWMRYPCPVLGPDKKEWIDPFGNIKSLSCGDVVARVILVPGHSRGGVCYWFKDDGVLLSGDTLLREARGLACFPGGNLENLNASLRRIFRSVPDRTVVVPGHGETTTVGEERENFGNMPLKRKKKTTIQKAYVSEKEMNTAFRKVRRELEEMGLLSVGSPLATVKCVYEPGIKGVLSGFDAMGYTDPGDGDIHIPAFFPKGAFPQYWEERKILDVIRHEFAHALADRYRKFVRSAVFKAAFGNYYGRYKVRIRGGWEDMCVSPYASEMTQEDFAETFMLFVKYKSKMPACYRGNRVIEKKWKAVARIVKKVAANLQKNRIRPSAGS